MLKLEHSSSGVASPLNLPSSISAFGGSQDFLSEVNSATSSPRSKNKVCQSKTKSVLPFVEGNLADELRDFDFLQDAGEFEEMNESGNVLNS